MEKVRLRLGVPFFIFTLFFVPRGHSFLKKTSLKFHIYVLMNYFCALKKLKIHKVKKYVRTKESSRARNREPIGRVG